MLRRIIAPATPDCAGLRSPGGDDLQSPAGLASGPYQIISDRGRIERLLLDLYRAKAPMMLNARVQARLAPVRLKDVDGQAQVMLVTQLWNDAEHAALMADRHVNLSAHHNGLPVFFTVDIVDTTEIGGTPCYRIPFPAWIISMEMRDSLRVRLPEDLYACLQCSVPPDLQVEARVIDISEGGIRFALPNVLAERVVAASKPLPAQFRCRQAEIGALRMHLCRVEPHGDVTHVGATIELDSELGRQGLRRLLLSHQRSLLQLQ